MKNIETRVKKLEDAMQKINVCPPNIPVIGVPGKDDRIDGTNFCGYRCEIARREVDTLRQPGESDDELQHRARTLAAPQGGLVVLSQLWRQISTC